MFDRNLTRRKVFALSGIAAAGLATNGVALAAPANPAARTRSRNQGDPITLKFAHMNSWNQEWAAELDTMVGDWNAANPGVQVEVIKWAWDSYFATMTAAIGAGEAPDVMNIGWGEVVQIGVPHLLDITAMLTPEVKDGFNPASFTSSTFHGAIYGLPVFEQMNQVLYYNADIAKEAGVTFEGDSISWDQLREAAAKMTTGERFGLGLNGFGRGIVESFAPFQYQNDSPMVEQADGGWVGTFETEDARAAAKYYADLWLTDKVVNPNNLGKDYTALVQDFGLGSVGMFTGITQNYFAAAQLFPELAEKIKVAPPQAGKKAATIGGAFSMSVFKYTKAPEEAFRFITWATNKENLEKYWLPKGNVLSTRPDVASPGMPDDVAAGMAQYQAVQQVFPFATQWETVREKVLTPRLAQIVGGQSDLESTWQDIIDQTALTLKNSQ